MQGDSSGEEDLRGKGMEQKRKRTHGNGQQCGDCRGWREGVSGGGRGCRGKSGKRKK